MTRLADLAAALLLLAFVAAMLPALLAAGLYFGVLNKMRRDRG